VWKILHPAKTVYLRFMGYTVFFDQDTLILDPVSSENLHNKSSRNFWCHLEGTAHGPPQAHRRRRTGRRSCSGGCFVWKGGAGRILAVIGNLTG